MKNFMRKNNFLNKLKEEEKLEEVEPSEEVSNSYLEKADNCLASAKLLFENNLYENSVGLSYYTMYNSLLALLFKSGIKCENHSASILLLEILFNQKELFKVISDAKEERIDKQYYITTEKTDLTKESAEELFLKAENFLIKIKLVIKNLKNEEIEKFRENFEILTGIKDVRKI
jgi:uncharacterized protein (UPF0332 family)